MRLNIWKFNGTIDAKDHWTPTIIPFGGNIRGLRVQEGSVLISPNELLKAINNISEEECKKTLQRYLQDILTSYRKETNE